MNFHCLSISKSQEDLPEGYSARKRTRWLEVVDIMTSIFGHGLNTLVKGRISIVTTCKSPVHTSQSFIIL